VLVVAETKASLVTAPMIGLSAGCRMAMTELDAPAPTIPIDPVVERTGRSPA